MVFWAPQVSDASPLTDPKSDRHGVCRGMPPDVDLSTIVTQPKHLAITAKRSAAYITGIRSIYYRY